MFFKDLKYFTWKSLLHLTSQEIYYNAHSEGLQLLKPYLFVYTTSAVSKQTDQCLISSSLGCQFGL